MVVDWVQAVLDAADRQDVRDRVAGVYADFQREVDERRPRCDASGRCCRFQEYGHRLYVTTIELAAFVHAVRGVNAAAVEGQREGVCPYQVDSLCSVHTIRPFGCRVFFCDPTAGQWQNEQYERFHAALQGLHEELKVPYRYLEWLGALKELGLQNGANSAEAVQGSKKGQPLSLPQLPL
jgi:Fe-S-cluster containining protein